MLKTNNSNLVLHGQSQESKIVISSNGEDINGFVWQFLTVQAVPSHFSQFLTFLANVDCPCST